MANDQDLQPALDAAQNELGLTFSSSDALDSRVLGVLGYDLAIGIFGLQTNLHNRFWLSIPAFILLVISLAITLYISLPRGYRGAIVDLDLNPAYFELSKDELVAQLLTDTQDFIAHNKKLNYKKARFCTIGIISSLMSTILLIGCIIRI